RNPNKAASGISVAAGDEADEDKDAFFKRLKNTNKTQRAAVFRRVKLRKYLRFEAGVMVMPAVGAFLVVERGNLGTFY
ncbi:hypothetical protein HK104_000212, partial [Borealophlyctis nickersoniae]